MQHTTYSCDHCGRTIDKDEGHYALHVQGLGPARTTTPANGAHSDLCVDCLDTLPPVVRHGRKQATS
jgi:hypothetical protein